MNRIASLALVLLLTAAIDLSAFESCIHKGRRVLNLNLAHYQPNDVRTLSGVHVDGTKITGSFGICTTDNSLLSLEYGTFSESHNGQDIDIDTWLLEYTWYNNTTFSSSDWRFYYGAGIGLFDLSWEPYADGVSYDDTHSGFSLKAGVLYQTSPNWAFNLETKYVASQFNGLFPKIGGVDNDVSATDLTYSFGVSLYWN
ncbi:MAG: outer membrane beta-barrel protein [Candidatus Wallbacteria bacterium]|nr:outer membrane beta-barrel protein [Candidatus Wallbacteria bacterium]